MPNAPQQLTIKTDPALETIFGQYPEGVQAKMNALRTLVHEVAAETEGVNHLHETLKWNEPAFVTKHGSTLRMDWKAKQPDQYAMYFQCTSQLVPTFRFVFGDEMRFEGNRAVTFDLTAELPVDKVKQCIAAALTYHKVKHLPTLGM